MREQNTEYILSLSYGKDGLACLGAIRHLGWPLDRIVTADVWATDTIPNGILTAPSHSNPAEAGNPGKPSTTTSGGSDSKMTAS